MSELTAVHVTDIHNNTSLIQAATAIAEKEDADVTWLTGDFVSLEEVIAQSMQKVSEESTNLQTVHEIIDKYQIQQLKSLDEITDNEDRARFTQAAEAHNQEIRQAVLGGVVQEYNKLKPALQELANKTKIVGTLGNHDLTIAYKIFSDIIDFAELKQDVRVKGKTGKDFIVKGVINSWEVPQSYNHQSIQQIINPYMINYLEGHNTDDERVQANPQLLEAVQKAQEETGNRLSGKGDILLAHKAPGTYDGGGNAAKECAANVGSICGGHAHRGNILIIDGKPVFTPGLNHIFVYDYNSNKKVEGVRIYRVGNQEQSQYDMMN